MQTRLVELIVVSLALAGGCASPDAVSPSQGRPSLERVQILCKSECNQGRALAPALHCAAVPPDCEQVCVLQLSRPELMRCLDPIEAHAACARPLPPSAFICDQGKQVVVRPGVCEATLQAGLRCRGLSQSNPR